MSSEVFERISELEGISGTLPTTSKPAVGVRSDSGLVWALSLNSVVEPNCLKLGLEVLSRPGSLEDKALNFADWLWE